MIKINDNGPGMNDDTLSKIFIPFYTTKQNGQGIGLSLSKQLIQLNGGMMYVFSKPGKGTEVILQVRAA